MTSLELAKKIETIMDDMKGQDIKILKIEEISSIGDYFVLATGNSTTQVSALADRVEFKVKEDGTMPTRVEGSRGSGWILIDYGSVIVHVFTQESRDFYDLDRLWQDAEIVK